MDFHIRVSEFPFENVAGPIFVIVRRDHQDRLHPILVYDRLRKRRVLDRVRALRELDDVAFRDASRSEIVFEVGSMRLVCGVKGVCKLKTSEFDCNSFSET